MYMSIWQTNNWKKLLEKSKQVEKVFVVSWIHIEKRKVNFWEYGLFAIGVETQVLWDVKILRDLQLLCKEENCLFIQVESIDYLGKKDVQKEVRYWTQGYFKKFISPFTTCIDLKKSWEEILSQMKPKGRYNIGLAQKKWVECHVVEKSKENITTFFQLFQETTSRDNFSGNTISYYENFLKMIPESELILAFYNGNAIAWGIFVFQETALYYYGASSWQERSVMAPYIVQWVAIEEAKKRGCSVYDFLWVAGPDEKHSPLEWVTDFKLKLSKDIQLVSQSIIYVHKKRKYFFIKLLKKLSKFRKK